MSKVDDNVYLNTIKGKNSLYVDAFDLEEWKNAWKMVSKSWYSTKKAFLNVPNQKTYQNLLDVISQMTSLNNIQALLPNLVDSFNKKKDQELVDSVMHYNKILNHRLITIKPFICRYLTILTKNDDSFIHDLNYWKTLAFPSKALNKIHTDATNDTQSDFLFSNLDNLDYIEHINNRGQSKINALDSNAEFIINSQNNSHTRYRLWKKVQKKGKRVQQTQNILEHRYNDAKTHRFNNWLDMMGYNRNSLNPQAICDLISNNLKAIAPTYCKLSEALKKNGNFHDCDFEHQCYQKDSFQLSLNGGEFTLSDVTKRIVPDLFQKGGWELESLPKRVGNKKGKLYEYNLINCSKEKATLYLSLQPCQNKAMGNYAAFAANLVRTSQSNPVFLIAMNMDFHRYHVTDQQDLVYLAHEIGHVLHFLSFSNNTFLGEDRMVINLSELPSVLWEEQANQVNNLKQWVNKNAMPSNRNDDYWNRRLRKTRFSLFNYVRELEMSWMDLQCHMTNKPADLTQMLNTFRQDCGLPVLSEGNERAWREFDYTESGGIYSVYLLNRSIAKYLISNHHGHIENAMEKLKMNILPFTHRVNLEELWVNTYSKTIIDTAKQGMDMFTKEEIKNANKYLYGTC